MKFQVKAGRFQFDKETKKVKAEKDRGLIKVYQNQEQQTHFSWINTDTCIQEIDLIVFGGDAVFQQISGRQNTFVLRFQMDEERYFFWIQEKVDHQQTVSEVNKVINYVPEEEEMVDQSQKRAQQPSKPIVQNQQKSKAGSLADMIRNLQNNLTTSNKQQQEAQKTAITHLYDVLGNQLNKIANELTEQQKIQLLQFMPEQQRQTQHTGSNIRSPQFLQALDVLSDAFNSENSISLFMELGLDQKYLYSHFGVQAFLRALDEWGKKKMNEKKQQKQEK